VNITSAFGRVFVPKLRYW